jgi:predicted amidohydrolase
VNLVRLATAQVVVRDDPRDSGQLRQGGRDVRDLMRQARQAGARIIHFPEGATCSPHKRIMSVTGPAEVGPADWGRADWPVLRQELAAVARLGPALYSGGRLQEFSIAAAVKHRRPIAKQAASVGACRSIHERYRAADGEGSHGRS